MSDVCPCASCDPTTRSLADSVAAPHRGPAETAGDRAAGAHDGIPVSSPALADSKQRATDHTPVSGRSASEPGTPLVASG